jgi:hypothetical protein
MNKAEQLYTEIGESIKDAKAGNMFGWKCFKIGKKPFLFFDKNSENAMVFKLGKKGINDALSLRGCEIFNPGDKGKPMNNWATVPYEYKEYWKAFALKSYELILRELKNAKR